MMMNNHKKMAMLIIKGLTSPEKQAKANDMEQGVKSESERDRHDAFNADMGPESAMRDFFQAYKDDDIQKAVKSMKLFMEMCTPGTELVEDESKGDMSDNPHGY